MFQNNRKKVIPKTTLRVIIC